MAQIVPDPDDNLLFNDKLSAPAAKKDMRRLSTFMPNQRMKFSVEEERAPGSISEPTFFAKIRKSMTIRPRLKSVG
jgi:hypothetical protein